MMYFFDLDGTLLDSNGIWLDIDIRFLGEHGISPVPGTTPTMSPTTPFRTRRPIPGGCFPSP